MEKAHELLHKGEFSDSQLTLLLSVNRGQLTEPVHCPLCEGSDSPVRPDQGDHIPEHLHSWALMALSWDYHTQDQYSSDSSILSSSDDLARLSNISEFSEAPGADAYPTIEESFQREYSHWNRSFKLLITFTKPLGFLISSFSGRLQDWAPSDCLDE